MKRDFDAMRKALHAVANSEKPATYAVFRRILEPEQVAFELRRLASDGLIESSMEFDFEGECLGGEVSGLTDEGREFYNLIERSDVWFIVAATLDEAGIDIPYPLLKEVCVEVVKRYVTSFIPEIKAKGRVDA